MYIPPEEMYRFLEMILLKMNGGSSIKNIDIDDVTKRIMVLIV